MEQERGRKMSEQEEQVATPTTLPDGEAVVVTAGDEEFLNTLRGVRSAQTMDEKHELAQLAERLRVLQANLDKIKENVKRERAFHEVELASRIVSVAMQSVHVEDFDLKSDAKNLLTKSLKVLDSILDREFPSGTQG